MKLSVARLRDNFFDEKREKYITVFLLAFAFFAAAIFIFCIESGGAFIYYGDYNYQQIPFYYHVHEAVREGRLMWDFNTDLGADLFYSYTFYLLGSPFFLITLPFPNEAVPYLMPWLLALKTAVAAVCAYAYIRGFSENTLACCLGALLYAFSGFQLYNIMFNHFHDATALFPLLLLASDKLFIENKRGAFAAAAAVCAAANYFFFAAMAAFTVIYFIANVCTGRYRFEVKRFLCYAFEAVLGVLIAAVILLPSAASVLGSSRAGTLLPAEYMLSYSSEPSIYLHILKGFFLFPDLPLFPSLPMSEAIDAASVSAYLPFVSLCGVIGCFFVARKNKILKAMLIISVICMLVPLLNSMFYMFNSQYYARWYFMPILIMSAMTAVTISEDVRLLKKGAVACMAAAGICLAAGIMLDRFSESKPDMPYLLMQTLLPIGCLALMYSMLCDASLTDNKARLIALTKRVAVCCWLFTALIIAMGKMTTGTDSADYFETCLDSRSKIDPEIISADADEYYRVDMCEQYTNRNLMWDISSCSSFISLVPSSTEEFYEAIGFPRGVNSHVIANYDSLRSLFSVKYYFDMPLYEDDALSEPFEKLSNSIEAFDYTGMTAGMLVYENNCYIPMGFTYDHYLTEEGFEGISNRFLRCRALLDGLVLDKEQIERHSDILSPCDIDSVGSDYEYLKRISEEKTASCCDSFKTDSGGFDAKITLKSEKLVFFSIPYAEGWSAYVNGEPVRIERVSYGFMAIRCPEGVSEIRFDYTSKPLLYGAYISCGGIIILVVYLLIYHKIKKAAPAAKGAESKED